jgi:hypothetical protein
MAILGSRYFVMNIRTHSELNKWLEENCFFEDGHVLKIESNPLRILIGYNVGGSYEANSERTIQTFMLEPENVKEWTWRDQDNFIPSDDNYIDGIEPIDAFPDIGLEFSTPWTFRLVTESIIVTKNERIKTTFKPWVSEDEIFVSSSLIDIPKPEYWRDKLKERGHDIVFRFLGSEEKSLAELPYPDYSGYYIQTKDRIAKSNEGIFIVHLTKKEQSISLHFQNKDRELDPIWHDLTIVLSEMTEAVISSGNCKFNGEEWRNLKKAAVE